MEQINALRAGVETALAAIKSPAELKDFFGAYLGKSGQIQALMKSLGALSKEERPAAGKRINDFKEEVLAKFKAIEAAIEKQELLKKYENESVDISMPAVFRSPGALHPVSIIRKELLDVFAGMGFTLYEGPEIEDDYHNFTALNTPQDHPARDKQDTFYITEDTLLRTHTSPGQIRCMKTMKPPFKVVMPGRVFRSDDDATHLPMFHQMEGLVIDKGLSMCDLYGLLDSLAKSVFSPDTKTRFRPSYFPFTEPSVEVDVSCCECGGSGCRLCKETGWIEILGGGVVNRKVIENGGLDPDEYTGLAFGTGLDRIAMLKYGVNNIHILYDGDVRILKQFKG
ncbi:MAG: phenylalanine--tRNA ligase subunit alpha [Oscillospiraceae bacterium]|jgi:phenylalanyl-tRNA synthetase alpha chain|nr:phenylalanine--tRNA ligase subunit alpha [Oscillospiraceae bacterium]